MALLEKGRTSLIDLEIDERLFESHTIRFGVVATDPKAADLVDDAILEYGGERYFITQGIKDRTESEALHFVEAEAGWMRLTDTLKPGSTKLTNLTVAAGLTQILEGTGWTVAQTVAGGDSFSLEASDSSVLDLLWQWAKVTSTEIRFSAYERSIVVLPSIGIIRGVSFRYGKNLTSIKRTSTAPSVTRLYPYGRGGIDISSLNAGVPYLEDYSYYTDAGYTLLEAQANYRKDQIWSDDSFIDPQALYDAAQARLEVMAQPTVLYEASVVDISALTGVPEASFRPGDWVRVYDEILDFNLLARVTRLVSYPQDPSKNKIELSFNTFSIPDPNSSTSRSDQSKEWELICSRNDHNELQIRLPLTIIHRLVLDTVEGAEWVCGFKLKGVGVGTSVVTVEAKDDATGLDLWTPFVLSVVDGQLIDMNFSYAQKSVPVGQYNMTIRASSDTSGAGLDIAQYDTSFWYLARGTTRDAIKLANSQLFNYTGAIQYFTVPEGVTEVTIECVAAPGGLEKAVAEEQAGGCKVIATFPVVAGSVLDVYVGGSPGINASYPGGWPDGGNGDFVAGANGAGGGGSSKVLPSGITDVTQALIIAGAGGGSGQQFTGARQVGGGGGFYVGSFGEGLNPGFGASQTAGGTPGAGGTAGSLGQGGNAADATNAFTFPPGGGGGGFYGGGGGGTNNLSGANNGGGGGGGSGLVHESGYDLNITDNFQKGAHGYILFSWNSPDI